MIFLKRKNEKCQSKPSLRGEVAISVEECSRRFLRGGLVLGGAPWVDCGDGGDGDGNDLVIVMNHQW